MCIKDGSKSTLLHVVLTAILRTSVTKYHHIKHYFSGIVSLFVVDKPQKKERWNKTDEEKVLKFFKPFLATSGTPHAGNYISLILLICKTKFASYCINKTKYWLGAICKENEPAS